MLYRTPKKSCRISVRITPEEEKILNDKLKVLKIDSSDYFRLAIKDPGRIDVSINWENFKRWCFESGSNK